MINEKEVINKVEDYLLTYIGNLVCPGIPFFDVKGGIWIVPILHMSNVATFPLDEINVDVNGNIVYAPTKEKLIQIAQQRFEKEGIKRFIEAIEVK